MSVKNQLQEIYQKNGNVLPQYKTRRKGGQDHNPQYVSTVILPDGKKVLGDTCRNKKLAESAAAQKALLYIKKQTLRKIKICFQGKTMVLIDLENKPNVEKEFLEYIEDFSGVDIFIFTSTDHPCLRKLENTEPAQIIDISSTRRDAADIALVFFAGMFCQDYNNLLVVTNDHFGSALVDAFLDIPSKMGDSTKRKAFHCLSFEKALQILEG